MSLPAPRPGDLFHALLDPVSGTEQGGERPVLVVSSGRLSLVSRRVFVCPVTTNPDPWPTKLALPDGLPVRGWVLTDQLRAVDPRPRFKRLIGHAPPEFVAEVRAKVVMFIADVDASDIVPILFR